MESRVSVDEINPEVARFQKVAVETGGINVCRALFCPRGPRLYSCALDYAGTEADYDGVPFDVEVYAPRRFRVHLRCGGAHHRAPPRFGTDRFDCAYLHLRLRLCGSMYLEMKRIK